ncbi:unnamed protein product [Lactuca virosa]|uniref:ABC-2 type transporter transmembrane domain-containing protein n=2 Tax=Lactuca TaxID=4235 RepID=A0AAU9LZ16_9ASTR|nr:unnamed protein product [Lactuca virosa]
MGCLYTSVLFLGIVYASSVQPVVDIERTVFYRERAAGMYSALPYAFAQVVVEIPYIFSQAVVFGLIVYAMIGFDWTVVKFFWFMFIMFCCLLYMTYFGMMSVAVTPNTEIASVVAAAFYGLWNLFSGYIIPEPKIPVWWRWYYWADPMAWTQYGLVVSQLGDFDSLLNNGETVKEYLRHYYGFKHDFIGVVAGVHVGFVVIFAVIFSFCIKSFNFQKR